MTKISKKSNEIIFENDYFSYSIGFDGKVLSFSDKNQKNYIANSENPYFCYLNTDGSGNVANPINAELIGDKLIFGFISGAHLTFKVDVKNRYISFEIVEAYNIACYNVVFANTVVDYPIDETATFGMSLVGMKLNTKAANWPSFKNLSNNGTAFSETGIIGAKVGIFGAPISMHIDILKEIAEDIPFGDAPVARGVGGPWAREHKGERGDYIIVSHATPEALADALPLYTDLNVDQLDFHKGSPFRQGDFYFFTDETGEASAFKEKMVSQLKPHGIEAGLHTYSFYIAPDASGILSDPKWQKQLLPAEKFTLGENLSAEADSLITEENTNHASRLTGYRALASEYILIDEELIKFNVPEIKENSFVGLVRGCAGTKPVSHKKGSKIIRIASYYSGLCPIIGSELYYEIARRTAKAYNEGGFGMIYFDALDGVGRHLTDKNLTWYYATAFVNEVLKYTETTPIAEMSFFFPPIYFARGRAGAWDHPRRGYKIWNKMHTISNMQMHDNYLNAIFGWYNLYPFPSPSLKYPPSSIVKYHFIDDVDHMASLAVAHDFGMVYQNVSKETMALPGAKRNTQRYALYNKLRKENYFPESIKKQVRDGKFEYCLIEKDGKYSFVEKSYSPCKIMNIDDNVFNTTCHSNPFDAQKPFIRLEAYPVATGDDPLVVLKLDENKELKNQTLDVKYEVLNPFNAAEHHGIHVKVLGNGSNDKILIRIKGVISGDVNACDYQIPLNFTGWKDFYLTDTDNDYYNHDDYSNLEHNHYLDYRGLTSFGSIQSVSVHLGGECNGVKMSSVEMCKWEIKSLTNPTIKIGNDTLTFKCQLNGGEYIEYTEGEEAKIYDKDGNCRAVDEVIGSITAPTGKFIAKLTREEIDGFVNRAKLTFGFTGKELK